MALLGESHGEVQRGGCLGDAALLIGERDHLGGGRHGMCLREVGTHTRVYSQAEARILRAGADAPASRRRQYFPPTCPICLTDGLCSSPARAASANRRLPPPPAC